MSRAVFKSNKQGQVVLFPVSLDEKVPQDSPARLVNQIVDNLDIAEIIDTYKQRRRNKCLSSPHDAESSFVELPEQYLFEP